MPRSRRAWILNLVGIASLIAVLYLGERLGGVWAFAFPVYLLALLALLILYRRRGASR
jgi:hypothetical protein